MDNFIGYQPGGIGKRQLVKEDVISIMDESGSVGKCQFDYGRAALIAAIKVCEEEVKLGISDCQNAAITFATTAAVDFEFLSPTQAIQKMKLISYSGGGTNTQAALTEAMQLFLKS